MKSPTRSNRFKLIVVASISLGICPFSLASQKPVNTESGKDSESTIGIESVPEPSTSALIGLAGLFLILRRRKLF